MKNTKLNERIIAAVLIVLLVLLANPFMFWMPSMLLKIVLVCITALVLLWAGFILAERTSDEREEAHRAGASRAAYLAAAIVLTIALVYEGFTHTIDFWIPGTLAVMVLVKLFTREYTDTYK